MKLTNTQKAVATAGACIAIGAGAGIVGSAAAPSHSKSSTTRSQSGRPHLFRNFRGPLGGLRMGGPPVHETAVVLNKKGDGFITVTSDSGTVKSVSGNDVTITEGSGKVTYKDATVTIPSGATVYRNGKKAAVGDLAKGDFIHVSSSSEGTFVMASDKTLRGPFGRDGDHHFGPGGKGPMGGPGGPMPGAPGTSGAPGYGGPPAA